MIDLSKFHVVCMISNPVGYQSRPNLYKRFKAKMDAAGLNVWTCEIAQGDRPFEVTQAGDPRVLQLRTYNELWHKENAINLMVARLPYDWQYVAWLDSDIDFLETAGDEAWYQKTVRALQTYQVVQLFQNAIDMGPNGEVIQSHQGFVYCYLSGKKQGKGYTHWHPGYAWAATREAWDFMGGLFDQALLGSGDNHVAYSLIGRVAQSVDKDISKGYMAALKSYEERCERFVRRDIGYIPGTLVHQWHGKKKNRFYDTRWKILTETNFDPSRDIKEDYQGLYQLQDHGDENSIVLRDRIRAYFRSRLEDSVDLE